MPGYRQEEASRPTRTTETYAAMKLLVDNWRWQGVPFYLRSGKRLPRRVTEIAIQFKRPPHLLFRDAGSGEKHGAERAGHPHPAGRGHLLRIESRCPGRRSAWGR